jgi:hypothetical protein
VGLFLVWHEEETAVELTTRRALEYFELRPGLLLVDSEMTLSWLYHRLKWALAPGTGLVVAPLDSAPKSRRIAKGAAKWLRERAPAADAAP